MRFSSLPSRFAVCASLALSATACTERPLRPVPGDHDQDNQITNNDANTGNGDSKNGTVTTKSITSTPDGTNSSTNSTDGMSNANNNSTTTPAKKAVLFIGGGSGKIDAYSFDRTTGATALLKSNSFPGTSPTFLAVDAKKLRMFAVNEIENGSVKSFSVNFTSGELKSLSEQSAAGPGPTHLSLDQTGNWLLTANYSTGHVVSYPVTSDGHLSAKAADVVAGMNAHEVLTSASNHAAYVPCLGSGYIAQYTFSEANGSLTPMPAGELAIVDKGPRHLAFHPNGKWVYLINETASSIQALSLDANGSLTVNGNSTSTLTSSNPTNSGAEIQVAPSGKFVYASNRGDDTIAVLSIATDGTLKLLNTVKTGGKVPRHFSLDSTGNWLVVANQGSDSVTLFSVNTDTGALAAKATPLNFESAQFVQVVDVPE